MADKLSVSDSVTVYQSARDGSSNLTDLLKRLKPEQRKAALETKTKDGGQITTPLIIAALNGHLNSVKVLLRCNADIEARGTLKIADQVAEGCTPLWAAAAFGRLDVLKLLIERNADVESRTSTGSTPLRVAAYEGHIDIVRCLVERGADVNARNDYESTPLMAACYYGHFSVVTYLIDKGGIIDQQFKDGSTALHYAVQWGHFKIVSELLALGALQLPNNQGLTPLLYACNQCSIEMVEHIIKRPECTKEQRIDALELLGATIANDDEYRDTEKAFSYMKRGMEMRYEHPAHPLLKKKMEPVEAYQNRKESQTLEELALLEGDNHAIGMEGLIIRERILGPDNPILRDLIIYRGAILADSEEYELCIGLWKRAMKKAFNCDVPIKAVTNDVGSIAGLFGDMVKKRTLLRPRFIEGVFKILVAASEKLTEDSQEGHGNEARRILSDKRPGRLSAMNVDVGDAGGSGSGTGKRRGGGGFVPGTEKDLNENTQKVTETKKTSGQLRELRQQLENVQEQLRQRDGQLREATQQLTNVQGQLRERDEELRQMTQQLTNVQGQLGDLRQQLTNAQRQLQEKDEENTTMKEQLRTKQQEVNELEISLSTAQLPSSERSRQQPADWVIPRDQIQLTKKCIGKGGWGKVVEGKYCGCTVAVKRPYKALLKLSPHNREKFEREMSIASKCRHPCLLQFIGATNEEGRSPLFVTELMETSLRKLLEQRPLSTTEVAVISLDVARALNYLHQRKPRPIIHRDISSANVLLWRQADQWRGKVADYGAANFMQPNMSACPGAAIYSAREAFTENQTEKVDVYSFGVLLCEMSTGKTPDPEERDKQVAMVTDPMFRTLIRTCLYQDPQERPTMEHIIGELEKLV